MVERKKQAHFAWRYQPEIDTWDAVLVEYLKNNPVMRTSDMMLQALRAFWLAPACLKHPSLSEADKKQMARDAVYVLMRQIDYLCSTFGLERVFLSNSYMGSTNLIQPFFENTNSAPVQLKEETKVNSLLVSELERSTGDGAWDDNAWRS